MLNPQSETVSHQPLHSGLIRNTTNLIAAVILLLLALILSLSAKRNSIGMDEIFHISSGVSYIQEADPRMNYEHPPLMKLLAGAGAIAGGAHTCTTCASWQTDDEFVFSYDFLHPFPGQRVIWFARLPMVMLTLLLALTVFIYGRRIAGPLGGLLSLILFSTFPLVLGFGATVMNDIAVTLFGLLTCLAAARVWRKPSIRNALLLGCFLGLALLAKFSAVLLLPFLCLFWAILWIQRKSIIGFDTRKYLTSIVGSFLVAFIVVYATYAVTFHRATSYKFVEHYAFEAHRPFDPNQVHGKMRSLLKLEAHPVVDHLVAPMLYYAAGVHFVSRNSARPTFLLGHRYENGTRIYFPVLTIVHTPLGFLAVMILAVFLVLPRARQYLRDPKVLSLALFTLIFAGTAMASRLNIGFRHFMPALVGCMVLAAMVVPAIAEVKKSALQSACKIILGLAVLQTIVSAVITWPFYIPYSNLFRFDHPKGWISSDSNVDHGFYLPVVHEFAVENHLTSVGVVPFSGKYWDLQAYIPEAMQWECAGPLPQTRWIVASTHRMYNPLHPGQCDVLWHYQYKEIAGGSMLAFDLSAPVQP